MKNILFSLGFILASVVCLSAQTSTHVMLAGAENGQIIASSQISSNPAFTVTDPQFGIASFTLWWMEPSGSKVEHAVTGNTIPANLVTTILGLAEPIKIYADITVNGPNNQTSQTHFSFAKQN